MSEAKDKKETADAKKDAAPAKKTLSLGGTLSLGASSGAAPAAPRGGVAVEMRSRRRTTQVENKSSSNESDALTNSERESRIAALQASQESEGGPRRTSLPKRQIVQRPAPVEEEVKTNPEDDARSKEMEELKRIQEEETRVKAEANMQSQEKFATNRPLPGHGPDAQPQSVRDRLKKAAPKAPTRTVVDRRGGRLTVNQALNRDYDRDRGKSLAAQKRAREKARMAAQGLLGPKEKVIREVKLPEVITVQELANRMAEAGSDVVKALMKMGVMVTITEIIDADTAELIIGEFGHKMKRVTDADVEIGLDAEEEEEGTLSPRPPVVTIMGHVDHGKTSLLDALREANVAGGEAGGITQHMGAYQVEVNDQKITFLDTPGHAAFTNMRARGADVTDICIIVVAANDAVMPQTVEAINHAKAANVPIIIAINKVDLHDADPQKVKTDLLQYEIVVEDLSGDVQCIEISAKEKTNLDALKDAIMLQAEILELKANPDRNAQGFVVESKLEKGRGSVATVIVQKGTLRVGDIFVCGSETGKVRALIDHKGKNIKEGVPGQPVEVLGLSGTPSSGDLLTVTQDEAKAREVADYRSRKKKDSAAANAIKGRTTMEMILAEREEGEKTILPVLVKGDVHGSVEAIIGSLEKMEEDNEGIVYQVLHSGVGGITESDVTLAAASGALIIGFNVRANAQAKTLATREGTDMRYYSVIYDVIDDAKAIMGGMLKPVIREEYIGKAKVLEVFNITKTGKVAGCNIEEGAVRRGNKVRLLRDNVVIHEGMLKTLKRFKDEVDEVKEGTECGMAFEKYEDIRADDIIECFDLISEERVVA
jgi:translation initiation factor IF-2